MKQQEIPNNFLDSEDNGSSMATPMPDWLRPTALSNGQGERLNNTGGDYQLRLGEFRARSAALNLVNSAASGQDPKGMFEAYKSGIPTSGGKLIYDADSLSPAYAVASSIFNGKEKLLFEYTPLTPGEESKEGNSVVKRFRVIGDDPFKALDQARRAGVLPDSDFASLSKFYQANYESTQKTQQNIDKTLGEMKWYDAFGVGLSQGLGTWGDLPQLLNGLQQRAFGNEEEKRQLAEQKIQELQINAFGRPQQRFGKGAETLYSLGNEAGVMAPMFVGYVVPPAAIVTMPSYLSVQVARSYNSGWDEALQRKYQDGANLNDAISYADIAAKATTSIEFGSELAESLLPFARLAKGVRGAVRPFAEIGAQGLAGGTSEAISQMGQNLVLGKPIADDVGQSFVVGGALSGFASGLNQMQSERDWRKQYKALTTSDDNVAAYLWANANAEAVVAVDKNGNPVQLKDLPAEFQFQISKDMVRQSKLAQSSGVTVESLESLSPLKRVAALRELSVDDLARIAAARQIEVSTSGNFTQSELDKSLEEELRRRSEEEAGWSDQEFILKMGTARYEILSNNPDRAAAEEEASAKRRAASEAAQAASAVGPATQAAFQQKAEEQGAQANQQEAITQPIQAKDQKKQEMATNADLGLVAPIAEEEADASEAAQPVVPQEPSATQSLQEAKEEKQSAAATPVAPPQPVAQESSPAAKPAEEQDQAPQPRSEQNVEGIASTAVQAQLAPQSQSQAQQPQAQKPKPPTTGWVTTNDLDKIFGSLADTIASEDAPDLRMRMFGVYNTDEVMPAVQDLLKNGWVYDKSKGRMANPKNWGEKPVDGLKRIRGGDWSPAPSIRKIFRAPQSQAAAEAAATNQQEPQQPVSQAERVETNEQVGTSSLPQQTQKPQESDSRGDRGVARRGAPVASDASQETQGQAQQATEERPQPRTGLSATTPAEVPQEQAVDKKKQVPKPLTPEIETPSPSKARGERSPRKTKQANEMAATSKIADILDGKIKQHGKGLRTIKLAEAQKQELAAFLLKAREFADSIASNPTTFTWFDEATKLQAIDDAAYQAARRALLWIDQYGSLEAKNEQGRGFAWVNYMKPTLRKYAASEANAPKISLDAQPVEKASNQSDRDTNVEDGLGVGEEEVGTEGDGINEPPIQQFTEDGEPIESGAETLGNSIVTPESPERAKIRQEINDELEKVAAQTKEKINNSSIPETIKNALINLVNDELRQSDMQAIWEFIESNREQQPFVADILQEWKERRDELARFASKGRRKIEGLQWSMANDTQLKVRNVIQRLARVLLPEGIDIAWLNDPTDPAAMFVEVGESNVVFANLFRLAETFNELGNMGAKEKEKAFEEYVRAVLAEEMHHLAHDQVMMKLWEETGTEMSYEEFVAEHGRRLIDEMGITKAEQFAARYLQASRVLTLRNTSGEIIGFANADSGSMGDVLWIDNFFPEFAAEWSAHSRGQFSAPEAFDLAGMPTLKQFFYRLANLLKTWMAKIQGNFPELRERLAAIDEALKAVENAPRLAEEMSRQSLQERMALPSAQRRASRGRVSDKELMDKFADLEAVGYKFIAKLQGDNGAILAINKYGTKVVLKRGRGPEQLLEEFFAHKIHALWQSLFNDVKDIGVLAPSVKLISKYGSNISGEWNIVRPISDTEWFDNELARAEWIEKQYIEGPTLGEYIKSLEQLPESEAKFKLESLKAALRSGYWVDLLLQNLDGGGDNLSNIIVDESFSYVPVPYRVSMSGALGYKSNGEPKSKSELAWSDKEVFALLPDNVKKMFLRKGLDIPSIPGLSDLYGEMSIEELNDGLAKILWEFHGAFRKVMENKSPRLRAILGVLKNRMAVIQNAFGDTSLRMKNSKNMTADEFVDAAWDARKQLLEVPLVRDEAGLISQDHAVFQGNTTAYYTWVANGRLLNPYGGPSLLTESQWRAVRTPNFMEWAGGDWRIGEGNVILDQLTGEPKVFYHSTTVPELKSLAPDNNGLYFLAEDELHGRAIANQTQSQLNSPIVSLPLFMRARKFLDAKNYNEIRAAIDYGRSGAADKYSQSTKDEFEKAADMIELQAKILLRAEQQNNPNATIEDAWSKIKNVWGLVENPAFSTILREMGYDAIKMSEEIFPKYGDVPTWGVFYSNNIKLAGDEAIFEGGQKGPLPGDPNTGIFSESPNIRASRGRKGKAKNENKTAETGARTDISGTPGTPEAARGSETPFAKLSRELARISKELGAYEGDHEAQIILGEYAIRQMMEDGRIKKLPWPKKPSGSGFEHVVQIRGRDVYKFTSNSQGVPSGYRAVPVATINGIPRVVTGNATPSEYLERWDTFNNVFGGVAPEVTFEGASERPDGTIALVVKQDFVPGDEPTIQEISDWLKSEGFEPVGTARAWFRQSDGVALADVKPDNFRKYKGQIIPLDIPITILPRLDAARRATRGRTNPKEYALGKMRRQKTHVEEAFDNLRANVEAIKDAGWNRIKWLVVQKAFNKQYALHEMEKTFNQIVRERGRELLSGKESAAKFAQVATDAYSMAHEAMWLGIPVIKDGAFQVDNRARGVAMIFKDIRDQYGEDGLRDFMGYMAGRRASELKAIAEAELNSLLASSSRAANIFNDMQKLRRDQHLEIIGLKAEDAKLHTDSELVALAAMTRLEIPRRETLFSKAEIEALLAMKREGFEEAFADYQANVRGVMDFAVATGLVSPELRDHLEKLHTQYVPFYRAIDPMAGELYGPPTSKRGFADQRSGIRRILGGTEPLNDLYENIERNMVHMMVAGIKNIVMLRAVAMSDAINAKQSAEAKAKRDAAIKEAEAEFAKIQSDLKKRLANGEISEPDYERQRVQAEQALAIRKDEINEQMAPDGPQFMVPVSQKEKVAISNWAIMRELEKQGVPEELSQYIDPSVWVNIYAIGRPQKGSDIVSFMKDGRVQYRRIVDDLVWDSFEAMSRGAIGAGNPFMTLARFARRLFQSSITITLEFVGANAMRDTMASWLQNKDMAVPIIETMRGALAWASNRQVVKKLMGRDGEISDLDRIFLAGAGDPSTFRQEGVTRESVTSVTRPRISRIIKADNPQALWQALEALRRAGNATLQAAETFGQATESANRTQVALNTLKRTGDLVEAAWAYREATTDFSLSGSSKMIQFLAQTAPFFNAGMQGLIRMGRAMNTRTFWTRGSMLFAISTLLALRNWDDDDYDKLPDDIKDRYWVYLTGNKGDADRTMILIPKPFEIGTMLGTVPERLTVAFMKKAEGEFGKADMRELTYRIGYLATNMLRLDPTPQLVKPILELYAGPGGWKSYFEREIEPANMRALPPEARYYPTTPFTARGIGENLGVSPLKVQHFVEGYFGTMGTYAMMAADAIYKNFADVPPPPKQEWWENRALGVGRFIKNPQNVRTKYPDLFYKMADETQALARRVRQVAEAMDLEETNRLLKADPMVLERGRVLGKYERELTNINKLINQIWASREMTPEEKRDQLNRLYQLKTQLQREGLSIGKKLQPQE
jgi:hypothetical protein